MRCFLPPLSHHNPPLAAKPPPIKIQTRGDVIGYPADETDPPTYQRKGGVKASCERREHRRGVSNHHGRARAELKKGGVETTCRPAAAYKIDPFLPISPKISPAARCCGGRTTRAVRSCCKNVGCSTISRILRFAYGLARRGVSNHRDHWSAGKGGVATGCERSEGRKGGIKALSERSERRRGWSVRVPQNYQIW